MNTFYTIAAAFIALAATALVLTIAAIACTLGAVFYPIALLARALLLGILNTMAKGLERLTAAIKRRQAQARQTPPLVLTDPVRE